MAVLDIVPGLSASICVDGVPLEEYMDDEGEEEISTKYPESQRARVISKYIESTSEKAYTIRVKADREFKFDCPNLVVDINIDGKIRTGEVMNRRGNFQNRLLAPIETESTHLRVDVPATMGEGPRTYMKTYRFAKIDVDESMLGNVKTDTDRMKGVGEIVVKVTRATHGVPVAPLLRKDTSSSNLSKADKVHEKSLKGQAKSHSTTQVLCTSGSVPLGRYASYRPLDGPRSFLAIFKFKYRSHEALKQLLILGRSVSPEPRVSAGIPVDLDGLNAEQKRKLDAFLKDLTGKESGTRGIKREHQASSSDNSKAKRRPGEKVVIDLTADDSDDDGDAMALN